ncbi:phytanoyl-CoA dioxygenase family protein [Paenibacillus sp. GCM10023248]|uniref:phytanoyl-CoA dioxygenase family protein n=1 Tax=Bacillales TaxID=1385 RepID=UPI002378B45E|nr:MULTISPECIES: phytanoyl-CoA dioxygenase family protein [Bacillales]MDD9272150.1 phytanoyl-CoA dioxygenase family protein [Paenibacillus sp. MAHUQ-63]MDR6885319.1 ectoine hydroxylase-related dioxygenase (phytanoyl-CoA dioxygenase family) [Bacillus sp. 3255]
MTTEMTNFVLTQEMIEQFYREGYFYARGFLNQAAVEAINRENAAFANEGGTGEWKSRSIIDIAKEQEVYPETTAFLTNPAIVSVLEQILGDQVKLWMGMYAVVAPQGNGLEWHQDNQYTHILGHMLNGFVALDEITQDNAGLWLAPGSHLLGRLPNMNTEPGHRRASEPENGAPCLPLAPGDAVFFHRETLHHSKKNHTDKPRRAYAFQAAAANCRYAQTGKLLEDRVLLSGYKRG